MSGGTTIDFEGLAKSLLDRVDQVLPEWLPGGCRRGHEYTAAPTARGGIGDSLSVNCLTGRWSHFAADVSGGDLVSLYAYLNDCSNVEAGRRLAPAAAPQRHPKAAKPDAAAAEDGRWRPIAPVPENIPVPKPVHPFHGPADAVWEYWIDGRLYGMVCRFDKPMSDKRPAGGKEILPFTYCEDTSDDRHTRKWTWKQWAEPRPLYLPGGRLDPDPQGRPVLLVEGEKCARAAHELIGEEFDVVSWPGGSKARGKVGWHPLAGRVVYAWPDADAKREALTRAEEAAGVDSASKPFKPVAKQPGMAAMVAILTHLAREHGCSTFLCPTPAPGEVEDGWDCADAIAGGWGAEELRAFIRGAHAFTPEPAPADPPEDARSTPSIADAEEGIDLTWRDFLVRTDKGAKKPVRENIVAVLDGVPEREIPGDMSAAGVIAFNEFTNNVVKMRDTPWGTRAGVWEEVDELELGNWLTREHRMPSMARATLEEAVSMVAYRHRFHPVRDELARLRGTWDGIGRLDTWIRRCCLEEDEWDDSDPLQQYLARVGRWLVMAICARVLQPGCKFDYMVIFEGPQGVGKSTLAKLLGGEYFADTGLVLGDKDSYQNLQGILVYEWGELDSLSKAEVTKVKQFISSQKDRFRASFDRRPKDYPRQVVFVGTTNEDHYLIDQTGNRRMWPVKVTRRIDLGWFRDHRPQLFAEALDLLGRGKRFHPSSREQRELFEPQQQQRQVENAIQAAVMKYLYDPTQRIGAGRNGSEVEEISVGELLSAIGIAVEKQTHVIVRQATAALRHAGWERRRSSRGDRPYVFVRPKTPRGSDAGGSDSPPPGDSPEEPGYDIPF